MLTYKPLNTQNFQDFEELFGPHGACAGCWCMFWKLSQKDFKLLSGDGTHALQKSLVEEGLEPGILAYNGNHAIGWIAFEPRRNYPRLARSRVLKPVDDLEVWSISCFFVAKTQRRKGVTIGLLKEAVKYVASKDGEIVEGYPVEPKKNLPDPFVYTGLPSAFIQAGFNEIARFSPTRPIFRMYIHEYK